jgi:CBS domain-containing protein
MLYTSEDKAMRTYVVVNALNGVVRTVEEADLRMTLQGFVCIEDADGERKPVLIITEEDYEPNLTNV